MMSETSVLAQATARRDQELDCRYGAIGISSVAAAVRYQGTIRNPKSFRNDVLPATAELNERNERAA